MSEGEEVYGPGRSHTDAASLRTYFANGVGRDVPRNEKREKALKLLFDLTELPATQQRSSCEKMEGKNINPTGHCLVNDGQSGTENWFTPFTHQNPDKHGDAGVQAEKRDNSSFKLQRLPISAKPTVSSDTSLLV